MKTEELRLRAKDLPLGFQIGQVSHPNNSHELLGIFHAVHRERGVRGSTGDQGLGGRALRTTLAWGRAISIIKNPD